LLPMAFGAGRGAEANVPLARAVIGGLGVSTFLTLFVVPVFYRILVPPLPKAKVSTADVEARTFIEPLPDVTAVEVVGMLEYLRQRDGEAEVFRIADDMNQEFGHVINIVKAGEMLDFVDTPKELVVLTATGNRFLAASAGERKVIWREQLLSLRLFQEIHEVAQRQPERAIDRDFVLETIVTRMPYENYEKIFQTLVRWARFGELFSYDEAAQRLVLTTEPS